jgi:CheY-like chemotaxis protein
MAAENSTNGVGQVLVVEDDAETLASISELLRLEGYTVVEARNGQEALERLKQPPPPAVIILDLLMPVMDGWEFLRRKKQLPELARIPVVVMTAVGSTAAVGAELILHKPVEPKHLLRTVAHYC